MIEQGVLKRYIQEQGVKEAIVHDEVTMIGFFQCLEKIIGDRKASKADQSIATLYRYMATYHVAVDRYHETLSCLEKSLSHVEKICENLLFEHIPHNIAWYDSNILEKQDRYDPIRKDLRFLAIVEKLNSLAK